MADFSLPIQGTNYLDVLSFLKARDVDAISLCLVDPTNTPTGAIKLVRTPEVKLQEWSGTVWGDKIIGLSGGGTGATTAGAARTSLGLGTIATQNANSVTITGGTIIADGAGITNITETNITATGVLTRNAANNTLTGINRITSAIPQFLFEETGVAVNSKIWRFIVDSSSFYLQTCDDTGVPTDTAMYILRTLGVVTYVAFPKSLSVGTITAPANDFELRSSANLVSGGFRISRVSANNDYFILNTDLTTYGAAPSGIIQPGNSATYTPTRINPLGSDVYLAQNIYKADATAFSPDATSATYDLGTSSKIWKDVYSNRIMAANGSASSPSYTFAGDTNTGIYWSSADTFNLVSGGTIKVTVTNTITGIFGLEVGTSIVPIVDNTVSNGSNTNRWTAVWAVNGTIQTSDLRMKKDVKDISYGLDFVNRLRPVEYKWKHDFQRKLGFIAQEVLELDKDFPAVNQDNPDLLGFSYSDLIAPLVKAIQELDVKITQLQKV